MRSKYLQKLAATALTTSLGVGAVLAGNLDQLNYVEVSGDRVQSLYVPPNSATFPATPWDVVPYVELMNSALTTPPPTFIRTTGGNPQNSATMIRGFIEPPQTGAYTFWVNGSADAEFLLSSNHQDANKTRIAYTDGSTGVGEWARRLTQKSAPINLEKGKQYFFELVQKSSGVGGAAEVGWWLPDFTLERPIPIRYAQRFAFAAVCVGDLCNGSFIAEGNFPTPVFVRSPGNNSSAQDNQIFITENRPYDLSPWVNSQYPVAFQWQQMVGYVPGGSAGTATDLPGEITSGKYIAKATTAEHNQKAYRIRAQNTTTGNTANSRVSYVTVIADNVAPTLASASASGSTNGFNVVYSENIDPVTATNKANYVVSNGVVIDRVELLYGQNPNNTVVIYTTGPVPGNTTVTVSNVKDIAANPNTITANSVIDVLLTDGIISYFAYGAIGGGAAIGGTSISDMINQTNRYTSLSTDPANRKPFPGAPDVASNRPNIGIQQNVADNYGVLITGFVVPPVTGLYNIVIAGDDQSIVYISQTADPASKVAVATDPQWGGFRAYTATDRRTMANTGNSGFISSNFPGRPVSANNATITANQSKNTLGGTLLTKGNKHFIEVLMKEGGGGDNVDVTWQLPGQWNLANNNGLADGQAPIPGVYLSQAAAPGQSGPISIVQQPASATTLENRPVTFSVVHGGSPSFSYQWYKNGIIVPDANAREFSEPLPDPVTENNAKYTVVVRNLFSGATSAEATLTVTPDTAGPQIVRAVGSATFDSVTVWFNEVVDPTTAVNAGNYSIVQTGSSTQLAILGNGSLVGPAPGGFTRVTLPTGPQSQGQNYTITINNVKDIANSANTITAASTVTFTGWVVSKGFVLHELWFNNTAGNVAGAKTDPRYPNRPDQAFYKTFWESAESTDIAEQYLGKFSGYFYANAGAGRYDFFLASDDNGELWLANDSASGVAQTRVAFEPAWGDRRSWTGDSGGRRTNGDNNTLGDNLAILNFAADERRYMELLFKEGGGGDYGDATMKTPTGGTPANGTVSALRGGFIGALANPDETTFTFSQNLDPAYNNGEGSTRNFTVAGSGQTLTDKLNNPQTTSAIFWQWQRRAPGGTTWTDIAGANGTSYTTPTLFAPDNNVGYRVLASIPGKTTASVETTLAVAPDVVAPTVAAASVTPTPDGVQNRILVVFSEPIVNGLLTSLANYLLTEGGNVLGISSVTALSSSRVELALAAPLTAGTAYTLTINNMTDIATVPNTLSPNPTVKTVTGWTQGTGYVRRERYNGIGGGNVANLTGNAKYPNRPDAVAFERVIETPTNIDDNFGQRLSGFITPTETADYLFAIAADDQSVLYLSTDQNPANKVAIVTEPEWGGVRNWSSNDRRINSGNDSFFGTIDTLPVNRSQNTVGKKNLVAGTKYYFEVLTKEGGGGDNCAVTWWKDGEALPADGSSPVTGDKVTSYVNPDNVITITQQPAGGNVAVGGSITLSVRATASSPFGNTRYYQWRRNGVNIGGATGNDYTISNAAAGNAGNYDAVVSAPGAADATSTVAAVTVGTTDPGAPTLAISKTGNNVTVTYPTVNQAAGHALEKSTALPGGFGAETGADVSGTYTKVVDVTAPTAAGQTYWRTRKP